MKPDNIKKEKNAYELKAEEWFKENGYDFRYVRQHTHLTVFEVEKDGCNLGEVKVYYGAGIKKNLATMVGMLLETYNYKQKEAISL